VNRGRLTQGHQAAEDGVEYKHPNEECNVTLQEKDTQKSDCSQAGAKANNPNAIG
jgi:hypothetical protein